MSEPRRVLVMDLHRSYLGAQRVLVDALAGTPARHEVTVMTAGEPRLGAELAALGVREVALEMPDAMASVTRRRLPRPRAAAEAAGYLRGVRRAIREIDPEVIVANTPKAHVIAAMAAPRGVPVGVRLHDVLPRNALVRGLVGGVLSRRTRSVACVSGAVRHSALGLGYAADRVVAFPNGAPEVAPLAPVDGPPLAVVVGQLEPWKGQDMVVRAFAGARAAVPDARLRVLGRPVKGPAFARYLRGLAADLGVDGAVEFEEGLTGVGELYAGARVLVHAPVQPDPLPTVVLEAMALGIPVVGTAVGGIPEMVQDGVTGLLVPPSDVPALTAALGRLLGDAEVARTMGAAGRERARERFSRARYVEEHAAWIDGLLGVRTPWTQGGTEGGMTDVAIPAPQAG